MPVGRGGVIEKHEKRRGKKKDRASERKSVDGRGGGGKRTGTWGQGPPEVRRLLFPGENTRRKRKKSTGAQLTKTIQGGMRSVRGGGEKSPTSSCAATRWAEKRGTKCYIKEKERNPLAESQKKGNGDGRAHEYDFHAPPDTTPW